MATGRTAALLVAACVASAAALGAATGCGSPAPRPSILLISIDTLRADHLSCYGYARETSPAIDRLAAEGVLFERAFAQSAKTATSHMTLMTSLYPAAHGVRNIRYGRARPPSPEIPTLASVLRSEGYRTEAYTGGGNIHAKLGFDRGFEVYEHVPEMTETFGKAAAALERLATGDDGSRSPFFLFVHTYGPHDPYLPEPEHAARFVDGAYAGAILGTRDELVEAAGGAAWWQMHETFWDRVEASSPADLQHLRDLYDALIRATDEQTGALLEQLAALGLRDDVIVVLLSDHGEEFFEHGGFQHNALYEELLHVPLVMRIPGAAGPRRVGQTVRLIDVMPTLLDLVGLETPALAQGESLQPLLEGGAQPARPVFSQLLWRKQEYVALRQGDWKYLRRGVQEELYNLADDPAEAADLAESQLAPKQALRSAVEAHLRDARELAARSAAARDTAVDDATRKQLEALGYVDDP